MEQVECRWCKNPVHPPLCNKCVSKVKDILIAELGLEKAIEVVKKSIDEDEGGANG